MPSSLEPGPSQTNTSYFSPSDVFTVLYGTNTARQVSTDEGGTYNTAQLRTAERINSGKFGIKTYVSCLAEQKPSPLARDYEETRVMQECARSLILLLSTVFHEKINR